MTTGSISLGIDLVAGKNRVPNPPTGTGIGFYVRGGQATVTPSQVDATDSANVMPVAGAAQFNDQNLSVYLIDSAAAPSYRLLAVFDPDN